MELKKQVVYVAALLACFLIASSEAVACFDCNSDSESGCNDPFKSSGIKICTGSVCGKLSAYAANGTSAVGRFCVTGPGPSHKAGCEEESESGAKAIGCICTSDYCNSAKSIIPSAWLLAVVGVLSMSTAIRK